MQALTLKGQFVTLETIHLLHYSRFPEEARSKKVWGYINKFSELATPFPTWFVSALGRNSKGVHHILTVLDNQTSDAIGAVIFYKMHHVFKSINTGTWVIPSFWGSYANTECKLLLLTYIFETLKFQRVEFEVDSRNERSLRAMQRIGAKVEGYLRKAVYVSDSFSKDIVVLSIIAEEWAVVKERLLRRLSL